jgi:hypothetical protein
MASLIDYIHQYGGVSFSKKRFNDVDNVILSLLAYIDMSSTKAVTPEGVRLGDVLQAFIQTHSLKEVSRYGLAIKDAYPIAKELIDAPRFADITVSDYIYLADGDTQFGAMVYHVTKHLDYICFEGTDHTIGGWKEDCLLACYYPVSSHILAADYLKKHIKLSGPSVILGGHSKGGNTALVSALMTTPMRRKKIRMIYSNDGPGLRRRELLSKEYKSIRAKYKHIVPQNSIVGMLLRQDENFVVHSNQLGVLAHIPSSWEVIDDKLRRSVLTKQSSALNNALVDWLDKHSDEERLAIVNECFDLLGKSGIDNTMDFRDPKKVVKAISMINTIPEDTRKLVLDVIKSCADKIGEVTLKNDK